MELLKMFVDNVKMSDLIITLLLIGLLISIDIVLFTHPKTRDIFTEEVKKKGEE